MTDKFSYLLDNLLLSTPTMIEMFIGAGVALAGVFFVQSFFLYAYGYIIVREDEKELQKKKDTLSDLILMKDIQTELEKEVEKAMLKATFQG